jgi:predicted GNAT superfamily acetyltransferase
MKPIEIRELRSLNDYQACVDMQRTVWGFDDPYDIVPLPLLVVSQRNGGILLGAFYGEKMIGFVYSLPGEHNGRRLQWSHMLAVLPEHQNGDIGYELKMEQYRVALQRRNDAIEWTCDPLESKNAYFNLNKLGCTAHEYEVDVYGETSSPLHKGMPTDRLIVHWPVPAPVKNYSPPSQAPSAPALVTRTGQTDQGPVIHDIDTGCTEPFLYVEIPTNIQQVKDASPQAALEWRLQTRRLFLHYLERDYVVYSFLRLQSRPPRSFYVLARRVH